MSSATQLVNGVTQDVINVQDRGLSYGHGVFETMRVAGGQIPLWSLHCDRLKAGLRTLQVPLNEELLEREMAVALSSFPRDGILKLTVTAGVGGRGYRTPTHVATNRVLQWFELSPASVLPVSLYCCRYRLPCNPVLAGIKHLNRLDQVMAAAELEGAQQGLLLNTEGLVIEGLSHNLFMYKNGAWHTPDLHSCGVRGVMRRLLVDALIPAQGKKVVIRDIPFDELASADEVFLCNSVSGILPVAQEVTSGSRWQRFEQTQALCRGLGERYSCFTV
jgi:4-amino-4-deoxychorismate lyase